MYAWGYVTAEDRLFQLSFKRLIGKGKLSKYLGPKALNVDKMFRELNFNYWAQRTAENVC
jgi:acyl-homoserine lactone acylase PvdQ